MSAELTSPPPSYTTRILPPAEWPQLAGTELELAAPYLDPGTTRVIVVEDGAAIVACWALFPMWHVEGLYIAPGHRGKGSVARRLWHALRREAEGVGAATVLTASTSDVVTRLLRNVGAQPLPGTAYVVPMQGAR